LLAPEKKPFIDPIKKKLMLMNEPATCSWEKIFKLFHILTNGKIIQNLWEQSYRGTVRCSINCKENCGLGSVVFHRGNWIETQLFFSAYCWQITFAQDQVPNFLKFNWKNLGVLTLFHL
jgi:hypothetical protein